MKDFRCKRCGHSVASSDGGSIYLLGQKVPLNPTRIKFPCPNCGRDVEWIRTNYDDRKIGN